ncbi:lactonase family protein [Agromyces mediolanus]|uniref:lactonase family protein n=1 Tax=Agromyces mediolanus TaxID=41986 RepID=UPI00203A449B|nr:beta-propeller fold lactonase family protein [Agromyces mediolanus]MCM3655856.1 lactonase family protein [Agromyces mediolanus]
MSGEPTVFWVGASTSGGLGAPARGIRRLEVDGAGAWRLGEAVQVGENPMFLALRDERIVVSHELAPGGISVWAAGDDAETLIPLAPLGVADGDPCHVALSPGGRWALAANYSGGSVTAHPVDGLGPAAAAARSTFTGSGPVLDRQGSPHLHQVVFDGGLALAPDLGADRIRLLELDEATGSLAAVGEIAVHAGAGPRHLVVTGRRALVANELDRTVSVVDLDARTELGWYPVDARIAFRGLGVSAIRLTRGGVVLVGDRDADALAGLRLDRDTGTLVHVASVPTGGIHPRDLELTHDERFALVADQGSDSIAIVALDAEGVPQELVDTVPTPAPACLARLPR